MRFLAPLLVVIQFSFAFHALKTGREQKWLWIIIFLPVAGCLAYWYFEIFSNSREERRLFQGIRDIARALNPDAELKRRAAELAETDSVQNKAALADECLGRGMFDDAIALYRSGLTNQYANDRDMLFGLARAHFYNQQPGDAIDALRRLIAADRKWHRDEVDLLLARAYAAAQDAAAAETLFRSLCDRYVGLEARYRYAQFLRGQNRNADAVPVLRELVRAGAKNRHKSTGQEEWLKLGEAELRELDTSVT